MKTLRAAQGAGARAMELIILTGHPRTSEALNAKWTKFDLEAALWSIPKERMKGFREHRVSLSAAALVVLEKAKAESTGSEYVFSSGKLAALSNMTCLATLKRMGRADLTVHGFRSTFRGWVSESTSHPSDVAEMALANAIEDKSEAAYRRGDLIKKTPGADVGLGRSLRCSLRQLRRGGDEGEVGGMTKMMGTALTPALIVDQVRQKSVSTPNTRQGH